MQGFLCPLRHTLRADFSEDIIPFPSAALACGKASSKDRLTSAAGRTVSAIGKDELIGGVLVFIPFRFSVYHNDLSDNN